MDGRSGSSETSQTDGLRGFDDFDLNLGDILRGERATLGKSLLDVQREIKVKASYLAAIEDADLTAFETPGFIAGYVRSYARYLGMDADAVYERFCSESGFSHVAGLDARVYAKSSGRSTTPVPRRKGQVAGVSDDILARSPLQATQTGGGFQLADLSAIGSVLVLALLVAGLSYGGWTVLKEIQKVTVTPVESDLAAPLELPGRDLAAERSDLAAPAPTAEALAQLYRPAALDRPVLVARDGPIGSLDPRRQGVYASYAPPQAPEAAAASAGIGAGAVPPGTIAAPVRTASDPMASEIAAAVAATVQVVETPPMPVMLFARNPVWVRVRAADGSVLLEKILEAGESYTLPETEAPPTLRAGNSGSLYFAVNGETRGPAGPGASIAKNVVLSPDALTETYQVADLSADPELARIAQLVTSPPAE